MNSAGQSSPLDFNRIIGGMIRAAQFDKGFFNLVEKDTSYTTDAWAVVALASIAGAIGGFLNTLVFGSHSLIGAIGSLLYQLVAGVVGFAIWAFLVQWLGTRFFKGQGDFGEVQRPLGFAYGPQVLNVLSFIPCLGGLIGLVAWIWSAIAGYFAIREALDQDNSNALLTIVVASLVVFAIILAVGLVLGVGAAVGSVLTGR